MSSAASSSPSPPPSPPVPPSYFERQSLSRCAVHTLNNLLQRRAVTASDMDRMCRELTPDKMFNPHKSLWGVGNYDVNVLMRALQTQGYTVNWFDRRKPLTLSNIRAADVLGYVLNVSSSFSIFGARHWIGVRRGNSGHWWLLDSNQKAPVLIHNLEDALEQLLPANDSRAQLLLVLPESAEKPAPAGVAVAPSVAAAAAPDT